MTTRLLRHLAFIVLVTSQASVASIERNTTPSALPRLQPHEAQVWHSPWQDQLQFAFVGPDSSRSRCEADRPPEALATPDPLVSGANDSLKITVSFIVGTDGRVHSPLILESAGPSDDEAILLAVQRWRYRPAMCNGVPTEVEAKVEFSVR